MYNFADLTGSKKGDLSLVTYFLQIIDNDLCQIVRTRRLPPTQ